MPQAQLDTSNKTPVNVDEIYTPVQDDLVKVQESLRQIVPPETELLANSIAHTMQVRGKLFRPLLSLLASGASGKIDDPHIETAAVAELIHVATLLHDDVLDKSDMRRGRSTVRALWGNRVSILSGDYLLAQASLKLSRLNNCRLVSIFATVLSNLCEGEVEQVRASYNLDVNWENYFKKSICKTASLFSACCESAGVLNCHTESEIQRLKLFGEKFGIAFQIIDDLLDYTSSAQALGKPVLDDLKNGILNAPILIALETFPKGSNEYQKLQGLIESLFQSEMEPNDQVASQQELLALLDNIDAIEKTQVLAERYVREACEAIAFLPDSPYRQALFDLTCYATQRQH